MSEQTENKLRADLAREVADLLTGNIGDRTHPFIRGMAIEQVDRVLAASRKLDMHLVPDAAIDDAADSCAYEAMTSWQTWGGYRDDRWEQPLAVANTLRTIRGRPPLVMHQGIAKEIADE